MNNNPQSVRLVRQSLMIACFMIVGMTAYESIKQFVDPHITIWESHIVTIIFSTIYATSASLLFLKKIHEKNSQNEHLKRELEVALEEIRPLTGLLPICASCKDIRDDNGYWKQIESYMREHIHIDFSHGICPDCKEKLYPGY